MTDFSGIHLITTGEQSIDTLAEIIKDIHPYFRAIHLRERNRSARELLEWIERLRVSGCSTEQIIVNDRVDVAHYAGLHTVQLASHSIPIQRMKLLYPSLHFGCSVHSSEELTFSILHHASYVIYGHIFATNSKQGLSGRGIQALQKLTNDHNLPVIAIGGITPNLVQSVRKAGAKGIALLSGVLKASDPLASMKAYVEAWETS